MTFEQQLNSGLFSQSKEKTLIDKLLAKEEVEKIKELSKKDRLTRSDLLELLSLIAGSEAKLVNYNEWDRYVILKLFVWTREFVKINELLFDYQDSLEEKENTCVTCRKKKESVKGSEKCECKVFIPILELTPRTKKIFDNCSRLIEHNVKFIVDLYLNIARTTLSIGATGILELMKNKFEVQYNNEPLLQGQQQNNQQRARI